MDAIDIGPARQSEARLIQVIILTINNFLQIYKRMADMTHALYPPICHTLWRVCCAISAMMPWQIGGFKACTKMAWQIGGHDARVIPAKLP